ncbi:hypothetical protein F441_00123 [Phytophthora nicotianae CJ01A1]|uniref:Uncharacterized protein n=1 Tax=Phytophthora nicotianae CJ01A1 TaxID=1317063 RepID=W2XZK6_PHYNI|nr:hypothetical protein F441_00123 [Phytophthora nicotianae CJ01A1]
MHLREEEVQWSLGRVISLACQASLRFQCQAGQLEMWNALFVMRSAHPQSIRVQEASLRSSEYLFRSNEVHITNLRPQQYLDDLTGVMDRFLHIETPRRRAHTLVVLALRVLVALYSSPRSMALVLFTGENAMQEDSIRSWLEMVLLLLRQHPTKTMETLFSPKNELTWWFVAVIEKWLLHAEVMNALLASLTFIFALPVKTFEIELQVALVCGQNLLILVCSIIDHYHHVSKATSSENETVRLVLLEAIRVVRQWSERPSLVPRFEASRSVKDTLLPLLIEQLQMQSKHLPIKLEILTILRNLAASHGLRSVLVGFESLQTSLKWLCCRGAARTSGDAHSDGDLEELVIREARNVRMLVFTSQSDDELKTRKGSAIVVSKVTTRRLVKTAHVKPETLRVYGCKK